MSSTSMDTNRKHATSVAARKGRDEVRETVEHHPQQASEKTNYAHTLRATVLLVNMNAGG